MSTTNPAAPVSIGAWQMLLLAKVAGDCGFASIMELLEAATYDVQCPGICTGCHTIVDNVEPDMTDGHCSHCHSNGLGWQLVRTVKSVLVLAELV